MKSISIAPGTAREKFGVTKAAVKYKTNRQYIYRWKRRYDGSVESLRDRSRRPHHHPNQHTPEEIKPLKNGFSARCFPPRGRKIFANPAAAFFEEIPLTTYNTGQGKFDGDFQIFFDFLSLFAG